MKVKLKDIHIRTWTPEGTLVGIVQIIHGMGEHGGRYDQLARRLNKEGYLVVSTDHRGHGLSVEKVEELGEIDLPFEVLIEDEVELTCQLKRGYPGIPLFILGHSMGSFMAQGHMKRSIEEVEGYILSGSCRTPYLKTAMGSKLGRIIELIRKNKKSKLMNKLLFAGYNRAIKGRITAFDWLSRDKKVVARYIEDPYCGFVYTSGFYASFLAYLSKLFHKHDFDSLDRDIPLLIMSGDRDPVGFYGRGVRRLAHFYEKMGFRNLRLKLYPGGRHEMINEINRVEVHEDILQFLKGNVTLHPNNQ